MDKYLMVILGFLIISIPISFVNPATGEFRDQPDLILFYAAIGGIAIILLYGSYKDKQERQKYNARRRSKK